MLTQVMEIMKSSGSDAAFAPDLPESITGPETSEVQ